MRLRIRAPNGVVTLSLPDSASVADLKAEISSKTDLPAFNLKRGYPPQPLDLDQFDEELKLLDTGIRLDGEQLIATPRDIVAALKHPLTHTTFSPSDATQPPPPAYSTAATATAPVPQPSKRTSEQPLSLTRAPNPSVADPPEIPLPSLGGTLVLRVMPDDNSCLFRAIGAAYYGASLDIMHELRAVVASTIQQQPDVYSDAVLERPRDAYCAWIQREDSWGGAIELSVLSQYLGVEVCSVNVQDLRVDRFNEGREKRVILVYSGIHYDVIGLSPSEAPHRRADVPAEHDTKVFDSDMEEVLAGAVELCRVLQGRHYYTDTAGFAINCNICGWKGKGEKGATEHAEKTGHMDFGEAA